MSEDECRLAYVHAYARLDEMVKLFEQGLAPEALLFRQREVIERELQERLRS